MSFLTEHSIPFQRFDHVAVFTCEESEKLPPMPGADTKNLFLCDEKHQRYYLVSVSHAKRVNLKALAKVLHERRLSFGPAEDLHKYLGVEPGSVTLLGVINDMGKLVQVVIDEAVWAAPAVQCHPLTNTATCVIPHEGMEKFLQITDHSPRILDVPTLS
jgi:Ala-tRNA(Pro) deacylase